MKNREDQTTQKPGGILVTLVTLSRADKPINDSTTCGALLRTWMTTLAISSEECIDGSKQ